MSPEASTIHDFVATNRKPFSAYLRKKLLDAGASEYVRGLGKNGNIELENEAAGVLLDLAVALSNRLNNSKQTAEEMLLQFPVKARETIRLPRSAAYDDITDQI